MRGSNGFKAPSTPKKPKPAKGLKWDSPSASHQGERTEQALTPGQEQQGEEGEQHIGEGERHALPAAETGGSPLFFTSHRGTARTARRTV